MEAYIALFFLVLPITSFGAPSVRVLGAQPAAAAASVAGAKVTPVKPSENSNTNEARLGSVRTKTTNSVSTNTANSNSRFPVITTPAHSYSGVTTPQTSGSAAIPKTADVDVDAIVNAVAQRFEDEYYDKNEVYNNNEFRGAVRDVDNPIIDAVRIGSKPVHNAQLPSDYVYIWIEED